jgi:hypothetical protein
MPVGVAHPTEYLARRRQVAKYDAIEGDHGHEMRPVPPLWLNSVEYWLFSHWPIITNSIDSNPWRCCTRPRPPWP